MAAEGYIVPRQALPTPTTETYVVATMPTDANLPTCASKDTCVFTRPALPTTTTETYVVTTTPIDTNLPTGALIQDDIVDPAVNVIENSCTSVLTHPTSAQPPTVYTDARRLRPRQALPTPTQETSVFATTMPTDANLPTCVSKDPYVLTRPALPTTTIETHTATMTPIDPTYQQEF